MGGLFGSKQPSQVTQTNKVEMSPEQKALFGLAFPYAKQFASNPLEVYQGSGVAPFNPNELAAQDAMIQAGGAGNQLAQAGANTQQFLLDPAQLDPESNPFLKQHGQNIADTLGQQFATSVMPNIRSGATTAGGMFSGGSSREGIAQGLAAGELSRSTGNALTDLYHRAYSTGLSTMTDALKLNPLTQASQLFGAQALGAVGSQQRAMDQSLIDEAIKKFNLEQQLPFMQAQDIMGLINGMPGSTATSTVTGATPQSNPLMSGLGGAASGAALAPLLGMTGPIGAGLGLLAGLLM